MSTIRKRMMFTTLAAIAVICCGFSGCTVVEGLLGNTAAVGVAEATITYLTSKYIQSAGSSAAQAARASTIKQVSTDLAALESGNTAAPAQLVTQLTADLTMKGYPAATIALYSGLLQAVLPELQALDSTPAASTANMAFSDFLSAVNAAASGYGA
jgi:hypothetical protein